MAPKLIQPDVVKPLFDLTEEQPFLLRPLTAYERSVVNHWRWFYKNRIYPSGRPTNEFRDEFIKYLGSRGFRPLLFRPENGKKDQLLFQDLFKVAPNISLLSAMHRITGLNYKLKPSELRDGFREFVLAHKEKTGQYPRRKDFVDASEARQFLPYTGIIVPHPLRLQKRAAVNGGKGQSFGLAHSYSEFFDIPNEISFEDFERISSLSKYRLEDLIDNLRKVQKWMDEQNPVSQVSLTPSRVDIENFARSNEDAVPWNAYESWIYHGTSLMGTTPPDAVRSLEWLRSQAGVTADRVYARRPKSNPRGFWTKQRILEHFCEAWRTFNPKGFQPSRRILADPPTAKDIELINRVQSSILTSHGKLTSEICAQKQVPSVQVPSFSTIKERYPGGYQGLLADIERRYEPSGGIRFSNGVALHRMASIHRDRNLSDRATPIRVAQLARQLG